MSSPQTPLHQQLGAAQTTFDVAYAMGTSSPTSPLSDSESACSAVSPYQPQSFNPALAATPIPGSAASTAPSTPLTTPVVTPAASPVLGPASPALDFDALEAELEALHWRWTQQDRFLALRNWQRQSATRAECCKFRFELQQQIFENTLRRLVEFRQNRKGLAELLSEEVRREHEISNATMIQWFADEIRRAGEGMEDCLRRREEELAENARATEELEQFLQQLGATVVDGELQLPAVIPGHVQVIPVVAEQDQDQLPAAEPTEVTPSASVPMGETTGIDGPASNTPEHEVSTTPLSTNAQLVGSEVEEPHEPTAAPTPAPVPAPVSATVSASVTASVTTLAPMPDLIRSENREDVAPVAPTPAAVPPVLDVQRIHAPLTTPSPTNSQHTKRAIDSSEISEPRPKKRMKLSREITSLAQPAGAQNAVVGKRKRGNDGDDDDWGWLD